MLLTWIGFFVFVTMLLFLDLFVLNKEDHVPRTREALMWTAMWTAIGVGFSGFIYLAYQNGWVTSELAPQEAVITYLTGYLVELSLSMDNVFVIAVIFAYFKVPAIYQHRVLFWGILGAVIFRLAMILAGVYLLEQFDWMFYAFGLLLLYSAVKMLGQSEDIHPSDNPGPGHCGDNRRHFRGRLHPRHSWYHYGLFSGFQLQHPGYSWVALPVLRAQFHDR